VYKEQTTGAASDNGAAENFLRKHQYADHRGTLESMTLTRISFIYSLTVAAAPTLNSMNLMGGDSPKRFD
jgi:hypothetical protein